MSDAGPQPSGTKITLAAILFAALLAGFWVEVSTTHIPETLGGHVAPAFLCFALLLAPLWFFGFGLADFLRPPRFPRAPHHSLGAPHLPQSADVGQESRRHPERSLAAVAWRSRGTRVLLPVLLAIPYLIFSLPRHEFHWPYFFALTLIPIFAAAIIEFSHLPQRLTWQDVLVLLSIAVILETRLLSGAWPYPGLGSLPKLYLADVVLYVYLVNRKLDGIGYSFVPSDSVVPYPSPAQSGSGGWGTFSAFAIGLREWLFFAPIGIGLGLALHFIRFNLRSHSALDILGAILVTFLLTAVPEELFFRGILQNLLEPLIGRTRALFTASVLFGLSHFHKGATFNWRYVLLAFLAGIFYGRAWRSRRQLLASSTTHTLVDVVWSLWFR